jgi:transcriptional regulator with XRE-family HTH domain
MDDAMSLKQRIGELVKKRRIELRMEQVDVQDYAEIGSTTLSRLEQGKANITIDRLEKILEVLGLELIVKVKG